MNIDSVNQKDPQFSIAVASILKTIQENVNDPFHKVNKNIYLIYKCFKIIKLINHKLKVSVQ